jgi:microcystin-dependent protein
VGAVWLTAGAIGAGIPAAGQVLEIGKAPSLFKLIGNQFGGDGQTTFALPDLRGAAPNGLTYVICIDGIPNSVLPSPL